MMSRNSSFKEQIAYCLEGLRRRLWSCALSVLVFFFAFPVAAAVMISGAREQLRYQADMLTPDLMNLYLQRSIFRSYRLYAGPGSLLLVLLMALMAVVCAVSGYRWLFASKETDFYHSLPVRREKLFATVTIDSFLITAIPYGVMSLISAVIIMAASGRKYALWIAFTGFRFNMTAFLFCYAVAVVAVMLTGQMLVCLLGTAVFYGIGPMIVGAGYLLMHGYFASFYEDTQKTEALLQHSSPVLWAAVSGRAGTGAVRCAVWSLVWFAVFTAIGLILYRKRPSEAAGRAIAFPVAEPVIKVVLSSTAGIFTGAFIHRLMANTGAADAWTVFAAACGVLLTAMILEIIYHSDFKKLFAGKKAILLAAVITAAVLAVFRFDLTGYDRWIPAADKVASVGIFSDALESDTWQYQSELVMQQDELTGRRYVNTLLKGTDDGLGMDYRQRLANETDLPDLDAVRAIAERGVLDIKDPKILDGRIYGMYTEKAGGADPGQRIGQVLFSWRLKNGRTVYRQYMMNLTAVRDELDAVHDAETWKKTMYPMLTLDPEELSGINYNLGGRCYHLTKKGETDAAPAGAKEILLAWQADMMELTADTQRQEMPVVCLQFKTKKFQEMVDIMREEDPYAVETFNNSGYYPVYPSFGRTVSLLEKYGLPLEDTLRADRAVNLEICDYRSSYGGKPDYSGTKNLGTVLIEDKEEMRKILEAAVPQDLVCGNCYGSRYSGLEIQVHYPAGTFSVGDPAASEYALNGDAASPRPYATRENYAGTSPYDTRILCFRPDSIPESVMERFGITEEDIQAESYRSY